MKTIKNKTIYKCDYCKKTYLMKNAAIKHENVCNKNPENIPACYTCEFCDKVDVELNTETLGLAQNLGIYYTEEMKSYNVLKCLKKDVLLIPIISVKKGNSIPNLLDDVEFIETPLNCSSHEKKQYN